MAQTLPSVARILAPRGLKLPSWDAADLPRGGLRTPSTVARPTPSKTSVSAGGGQSSAASPTATAPVSAPISAAVETPAVAVPVVQQEAPTAATNTADNTRSSDAVAEPSNSSANITTVDGVPSVVDDSSA